MKTKMKNLFKKIIKTGIPCGYCPNYIWKKNEVGGKIHFINKKPVCIRCRVLMLSKLSDKIAENNKIIDKALQASADQKVREFALKKQIETGTGRLQINK